MNRKALVPSVLLLLLFLSLPRGARAEMYFDLFAGSSRSATDNASVTTKDWGLFGGSSTSSASREVSFSSAPALGMRVRSWYSKALWVGFGGELSWYRARGERVTADLFPISLQVLLRAPLLPHPDYPVGRLHPYLGAGLSYVFGSTKVDLTPEVPREVSGWTQGPGFTALGGVAGALSPRTFLFAEGRWTRFDAKVDTGDGSFALFSDDHADVELSSTQVLLGISFRIGDDPPRPAPAASPPPPPAAPPAGSALPPGAPPSSPPPAAPAGAGGSP